jgi:hypothetical protein
MLDSDKFSSSKKQFLFKFSFANDSSWLICKELKMLFLTCKDTYSSGLMEELRSLVQETKFLDFSSILFWIYTLFLNFYFIYWFIIAFRMSKTFIVALFLTFFLLTKFWHFSAREKRWIIMKAKLTCHLSTERRPNKYVKFWMSSYLIYWNNLQMQ